MKSYLWVIVVCLTAFLLQCNFDTQSERLINGAKMPNIEGIDQQGNTISLASIENKIVLVDFWASWCKPCIKAFPDMEKLYQKYKNAQIGSAEGFEILSVSLDEKRETWEKVLKRKQPSWKYQLIDTTAFTSKYLVEFQFEEIPAYFLVDERGIIIGRDQTFAWMDYELKRRMN